MEFLGIPILYTPYIDFSLTNERLGIPRMPGAGDRQGTVDEYESELELLDPGEGREDGAGARLDVDIAGVQQLAAVRAAQLGLS